MRSRALFYALFQAIGVSGQVTRWAGRLALFGVLAAVALPAGLEAQAARHSHEADIWFHPLPSASAWPTGQPVGGATDFRALFKSNAAWPRVIARVKAVGMYAAWIVAASDQELRTTVAFLNQHDMGIEIEAPALQAPPTCGSGVEGYVPWGQSLYDFTLAYLNRLKALDAQVAFVKVDEPFFFGSISDDPRACRLPVAEVALAVGQYARLVKTVYPHAEIGDVEPIIEGPPYPVDVVTAMAQWHEAYRTVTGTPFPFFFADIDFSNPAWPTIVKALEDQTRQSGMQFGIIYIGDEQDTSDAEWADKAVARFRIYQEESGGRPDHVLFQSWEPHPLHCLPETDPTTFTGVIDAYIREVTPYGSWP